MPGVVDVLTGADLANDKVGNLICGWMITSKDGSPMKMAPHPALAHGKVNHVGDAIAVVIAETVAQGKDAAEKVAKVKRPVAVKYRTPDGQEWTGRGRQPKFVVEFLANGGTLEQLAV